MNFKRLRPFGLIFSGVEFRVYGIKNLSIFMQIFVGYKILGFVGSRVLILLVV